MLLVRLTDESTVVMTAWNLVVGLVHWHIDFRPLDGFVRFLEGFHRRLFSSINAGDIHQVNFFLLLVAWRRRSTLDCYRFLFNWICLSFLLSGSLDNGLRTDWLLFLNNKWFVLRGLLFVSDFRLIWLLYRLLIFDRFVKLLNSFIWLFLTLD